MDEGGTSRYLFSLSLSEEQHKGHILLRRCPGANAPSGPQGCSSEAALSARARVSRVVPTTTLRLKHHAFVHCVRAKNRAKKPKRNQSEEDEVDMTGDIVLKVLKISGSRPHFT